MWVDNARWPLGTAESVWLSESVRARASVCVCVSMVTFQYLLEVV